MIEGDYTHGTNELISQFICKGNNSTFARINKLTESKVNTLTEKVQMAVEVVNYTAHRSPNRE